MSCDGFTAPTQNGFPVQTLSKLNLVSKNHNNAFGLIQFFTFIQGQFCVLVLADSFFFKAHIVVELFDSSDIACIDGKDYREGVWVSKPGGEQGLPGFHPSFAYQPWEQSLPCEPPLLSHRRSWANP